MPGELLIARNPDRDSTLPFLVPLPLGADGLVLKTHGGHLGVGVDHGGRVVEAAVDVEVEVELGGRREAAVDDRAVEVDKRYLLGLEVPENGAGRRDRNVVAGAS